MTNGSKASFEAPNNVGRILFDSESECESVHMDSDVESTLSVGNARSGSCAGSAREEESSRAAKRAASPSDETLEPERARREASLLR